MEVMGHQDPISYMGRQLFPFSIFYSLLLFLDLSFCSSFVMFICFWFFGSCAFDCGFQLWFYL